MQFHPYNRRRQVQLSDDGSITADALDGILEYQDFLCAICGEIPRSQPSLDHIIPLSRGGAHTVSNIQLVCWPCNTRKAARLPPHVSDNRTLLDDRYFPHPLETVFAISAFAIGYPDLKDMSAEW